VCFYLLPVLVLLLPVVISAKMALFASTERLKCIT
jgi:hypothetical protein